MGKHEKQNYSSKINFENPPEGFEYAEMPISKEMLPDWELDPRYITYRKNGGRRQLCYMVLVPDQTAREYNQSYENEIHREARERRCRITSEKTGKTIRCPDDRSCVGCPFNDAMRQDRSSILSLDKMQEDGYDAESHDRTSDEALTGFVIEELLEELRDANDKLAKILELRLQGYEQKQIGQILGIKKSTLSDDMKKIRTIATKYI